MIGRSKPTSCRLELGRRLAFEKFWLTCAALAWTLRRGSTLVLMLGKVLKGFQRVRGGEIQAAVGAIKARSAVLAAFIHQCGPGYRSWRQFSQDKDFLWLNCTLRVLSSSKF